MYCSDYYFLIKNLFTGDLYASREDITGHWMDRAIIGELSHCQATEQDNKIFCSFMSVLEENYTCK